MAKKKVFVSFDFDNDKTLKDFIIGQAKQFDSPFEVIDFSLKEAAPEKTWIEKAKAAISRAEVFIVMLGPKTKNAPGVLKEAKIANELGKEKFQVIGYKDGSKDWAVPNAFVSGIAASCMSFPRRRESRQAKSVVPCFPFYSIIMQ